jgi:hypothetical protein
MMSFPYTLYPYYNILADKNIALYYENMQSEQERASEPWNCGRKKAGTDEKHVPAGKAESAMEEMPAGQATVA